VTVTFAAGGAKPEIGVRGWNLATQTLTVQ